MSEEARIINNLFQWICGLMGFNEGQIWNEVVAGDMNNWPYVHCTDKEAYKDWQAH